MKKSKLPRNFMIYVCKTVNHIIIIINQSRCWWWCHRVGENIVTSSRRGGEWRFAISASSPRATDRRSLNLMFVQLILCILYTPS
jgi:hypothetical protein